MIDDVREYIELCPHLKEFTSVNIDYLVDKVTAYSIHENSSYDPILEKDILGNKICQFQFNFDARLYWNEELANNVANNVFFENFRDWLMNMNDNKKFPKIKKGQVQSIEAKSNGYIFLAQSDEAIYRISCVMKYFRKKGE